MDILIGFLYGIVGGVFAELLALFKLREQVDLPSWLRSPFYWIVTVLMICAGGLLAMVYVDSGITLNALLAVNVGASAPLIIGSFVAQTPSVLPGKIG